MELHYNGHLATFSKQPPLEVIRWLSENFSYDYEENGETYTKRLYDIGRKSFPAGLLERFLKAFRSEVTLKAIYPIQPVNLVSSLDSTMRYYQSESLNKLIKVSRGCAELPTGSGKTILTAAVADHCTGVTLVTVPSMDLLKQTIDEFKDLLKQPIGMIGDGKYKLENITVSTIQTLASMLSGRGNAERNAVCLEWLRTVNTWICDECHGAATTSYTMLSKAMPQCMRRYGVSATWRREDGKELEMEGVLGYLRHQVPPIELIDGGYLTRPFIRMPVFDHRKANATFYQYSTMYTKNIVTNGRRNQLVVDEALGLLSEGINPILVMFESLDHGDVLYDMIRPHCRTRIVNGTSSKDERTEVKNLLLAGDLDIVVASSIWVTGINIPNMEGLIVAGAGRSGTSTAQRAGRVLRLAKNKDIAHIVDIWDTNLRVLRSQARDRRHWYMKNYPGCLDKSVYALR